MAKALGKLVARILGYGFLVLLVLVVFAITFTVGWRPIIGAKERALTPRKFDVTQERLRRGQYLTHAVTPCFGCHSAFDETKNPPVMVSKEGAGRVMFEDGGLKMVAPNITPDADTGIGKWSDDAIARAIREGVAADGRALFPVMPYQQFRHMSDEDLASIVVYLRSLAPARSELPPSRIPFFLARIIQTIPQPLSEPVAQPDQSTPALRGAYLATLGTCGDCHTPTSPPPTVQPIAGMEFAGGTVFPGNVASANITPDASGIGYYDDALFIQVMRTGAVRARKLKMPMPWPIYGNMTDDDLKALFAYLRTLKPVHHEVDNGEPPTQCRLCGHKHGSGNRN